MFAIPGATLFISVLSNVFLMVPWVALWSAFATIPDTNTKALVRLLWLHRLLRAFFVCTQQKRFFLARRKVGALNHVSMTSF